MNNRDDAFVRKFSDAQLHLNAKSIQNIVSLKYRANVEPSDYRQLIEGYLDKNPNFFKPEHIYGVFQGTPWLVKNRNGTRFILVEHESGPEFLYIAGSVASLLSLIPMIRSAWKNVQDRGWRRSPDPRTNFQIERRILNIENHLIEEQLISLDDYIIMESLRELLVLKERVKKLEQQITTKSTSHVKPKITTKVSRRSKK